MILGDFELGYNDTPECGIYTGDAFELSKGIPDESIDLIFTDPVYQEIEHYHKLAEIAARVLKPNSACLAWVSKAKQYECHGAMADNLNYMTTLFYTVVAKQCRPAFGVGIMSWTTPALVFCKGKYKCYPFMVDTYRDAHKAENGFDWQKNTGVYVAWMQPLNKGCGVVLDLFGGTGTTAAACVRLGINYLLFEIDATRALQARERARNTQPPLLGQIPEQPELLPL